MRSQTDNAPDIAPLVAAIDGAEDGTRYIVDFDQTLMLSNSTEEFVNTARPALVFAFLMKVLGALRPWALTGRAGYFVWRDVLRVGLICLLAPWTPILFRANAPALFREHLNYRLDKILGGVDPADIVIVSFGFKFVLRALLKGSRYESARLVAPTFWQMAKVRQGGKANFLKSQGLSFDLQRDFVITDSAKDDADLLGTFANGFCIKWPETIRRGAFSKMYLPFFYTSRIKRSLGFFVKQIVLEELPIILLAFGLFLPGLNLSVMACLTLFFAAYIAVYEIGYAENDRIGFAREAAPKLTDAFYENQNYRLQPYAWIWAAFFTMLGTVTLDNAMVAQVHERLHIPGSGSYWADRSVIALVWMAVIVAGRFLFWVFNRSTLKMRVFAYLPLHASKYLGPLLLFPTHPVGFALLMAHIVRTWALYAVRRAGGDIDFLPSQLVRLAFLILFLPTFALAGGIYFDGMIDFLGWQAALIVAFCVLRAAPEFYKKVIVGDPNGSA